MLLLGIDIGTTNSKAGLFTMDGKELAVASRQTVTHKTDKGISYHDPEEMWQTIASAIREAAERAEGQTICAVGIGSMAESGLLIGRNDGKPRSFIMPWFDACSIPQAERIAGEADAFERFQASGLHNSFKYGLAKLLWLKEHEPESLKDAVWLSTAGYIAHRLTGSVACDYSLAARTYAFRIDTKQWDADWIRNFGLEPSMFPETYPSGEIVGRVSSGLAVGLPEGTPVAIAGHDHVAAALSVGAVVPGLVYDSMGTAETLVGTLEERTLTRADYESGLSFGCHAARGRYFWMGGNSSSGGSVEWLRKLLADDTLSYETLLGLLATGPQVPTGILYFPYLSGCGAPMPDVKAKASFVGLTKAHGKADLIRAVLEGTAYQLEWMRESAERVAGGRIEKLLVVGGGTRNPHWLQIKADVSGCRLELPPISEATLLGSALAAGVGCGCFASAEEAGASVRGPELRHVAPNPEQFASYRKLYETGYVPLNAPLRAFFRG